MTTNIFDDFEQNRQYVIDRLDGITAGVSLFTVADKIRFLYFNQAADHMFGYEKGGLLQLCQQDFRQIFHPDHAEQLAGEIIAALRKDHFFHYDCRILCQDGTYQWANLSAELVRQQDGKLCFYCVFSVIDAPRSTLLAGRHFLLAAAPESGLMAVAEQIEAMGGTCQLTGNGMDALELLTADTADYAGVLIGWPLAGLNGLELAKDLRTNSGPACERVPLILFPPAEPSEYHQFQEDLRIAGEETGIHIDATFPQPLDMQALTAFLISTFANAEPDHPR